MDSIDKFGRHLTKSKTKKSIPTDNLHPILETSADGHYNFQNKRLCNVQSPVEADDCANKAYVDKKFKDVDEVITTSKSPYFNQITEFIKLQVDVDDLKRATVNITHETDELSNNVSRLNKEFEAYKSKADMVSQSDAKFRLNLDVVEQTIKRNEVSFKTLLTDLETKIDNKIEKLSANNE